MCIDVVQVVKDCCCITDFSCAVNNFIIVTSSIVVHCFLRKDFKLRLKKTFFSAQHVSAQRLSPLFFFVIFVEYFKCLACFPRMNLYQDICFRFSCQFCAKVVFQFAYFTMTVECA